MVVLALESQKVLGVVTFELPDKPLDMYLGSKDEGTDRISFHQLRNHLSHIHKAGQVHQSQLIRTRVDFQL